MRARKFRKPRQAKKVYLVICEGETEREYVEMLKRHFRVPITIKTKVSGNALNPRLVKQYIAELNVDSAADYDVFYVYDEDVRIVADRLRALPGIAILSNPCIELWFLLHTKDCCRQLDADEIVRLLRNSDPRWHNYSKGTLDSRHTQVLTENYSIASQRARKLSPACNPSSNMYEFIDLLEAQKH